MKDEADEETWQTYQDYRRRGIFDEDLPEQKAWYWRKWAANNVLDHFDPLLQDALAAANVDLDLKEPSALRLRQDALRLVAAAYQIDLDRWKGDFGHGQSAPEWVDDKCPMPTAVLQTWSGRLTPFEVNFLARSVQDVAEEYIKENVKHVRSIKTRRDWKMALRYFVDLCEKERIGDVTENDVDEFRKKLTEVPSEFGKGIYADQTPRQAIKNRKEFDQRINEAIEAGNATLRFEGKDWTIEEARRKTRTMSRKTANKHLSFFTKM